MSPIIGIALAHDTPADILFNEEEVDGDPGVHKRINFAEYEAEVQKQEAEENATLTGQSPSFIPPDLGGVSSDVIMHLCDPSFSCMMSAMPQCSIAWMNLGSPCGLHSSP